MYLEFHCNRCGQHLRIRRQFAHATIQCPHCEATQIVDSVSNDSVPAAQLADDPSPQQLPESTPPPSNPYREAPVTTNPYGTPQSHGPAPFELLASRYTLAQPASRLVATIVDWLFFIACWLPGAVVTAMLDSLQPQLADALGAFVLLTGLLGGGILQWYRISVYGQSIGKQLMGIRIVTRDGNPPGFLHGVVLRLWLFLLLLPCYPMAGILYFVDALFIFSEHRQCLHDLVASTFVVQVDPRANTTSTSEFDPTK